MSTQSSTPIKTQRVFARQLLERLWRLKPDRPPFANHRIGHAAPKCTAGAARHRQLSSTWTVSRAAVRALSLVDTWLPVISKLVFPKLIFCSSPNNMLPNVEIAQRLVLLSRIRQHAEERAVNRRDTTAQSAGASPDRHGFFK